MGVDNIHKALKGYGLENFGKKLDSESLKAHSQANRSWGADIPSQRLLKGLGAIQGGYFKHARKYLEGITMDEQHQILNLFLEPPSHKEVPMKEKVQWILKHFKYEKDFPEIALKAYAAIGDTKKVDQLLNRGVKDSIGATMPPNFRKSAIEYCIHQQNPETFKLLLKRVPLSDIRALKLLNACLSKVQNQYGLELLKKVKNKEIIFEAYKTHAREAYTYEDRPKMCVEMEKKLSDGDIHSLLKELDDMPTPIKALNLERMEKSLRQEKTRRRLIYQSKEENTIAL